MRTRLLLYEDLYEEIKVIQPEAQFTWVLQKAKEIKCLGTRFIDRCT